MRSMLFAAFMGVVICTSTGASAQVTGTTGGGQTVQNYQPSLALIQATPLQGIFPCNSCAGDPPANTLGGIRTFAGSFAPGGSPTASGQVLSIAQNTALFSILSTSYGGNGQTTYALPDLGGRAIIGAGAGVGLTPYVVGEALGSPSSLLTIGNLPVHAHDLPDGGATGISGASTPFDNLQPSLAMNYQIAVRPEADPFGSTPLLGQVGAFGGHFEPGGWLNADGRLLSTTDYDPLFQLIGTTYGGDGLSTFALPDLRGRLAVGTGNGLTLGEVFGSEQTFLTSSNLPSHDHTIPGDVTDMFGGGLPYDNGQPSLALNFLIALQGVFPPQDRGLSESGPYVGEVVGYAGDFVPNGWALAQGQILQISQNTALFSLLGTAYGGNGQTTFALPDLRGRTIIGTNAEFSLGEVVGERDTILTVAQMAAHDHALDVTGVPEPSTWAMLLLGFLGAGAVLRRRRAVAA